MEKILLIHRQAIGNHFVAVVCLYVGRSSEEILFYYLMRWTYVEGGLFGGSSMFKKVDQNSVSLKQKKDFCDY